ncbi:MAG: D-alanine--D-alanine ligase [Candidatus Cloacimonetes bacterium]|nr:D-alanine--D-alanine ligase [Candidatus Cloacimonadota bacterium]MCF7883230.1 D-alanine--D-alanine ligase [Candidatus Cloacimonadota bacterium]
MKNEKIVILSGGFSEEAEVSRITSEEINKSLQGSRLKTLLLDPADFKSYGKLIEKIRKFNAKIVFNGLHGTDGEDGKIQALLDLEKIPYTGSDSRSSAIAMDKEISGIIAQSIGLELPQRSIETDTDQFSLDDVENVFGFPFVIKPNDSGSSVGISIVKNKEQIIPAFLEAKKYSDKVIFEKFISGRELTVTILDDKPLPVVEIKPKNGWYDFNNKYTKGNTIYESPAELEDDEINLIQSMAVQIFKKLGCSVYGRVDFRFDGEKFFFLEVNTLPGMTELSLTPMAAKSAGISFDELLIKIIEISLKRF